jgi:acetyltransferase-like isoleucine patch superfamily enzyme
MLGTIFKQVLIKAKYKNVKILGKIKILGKLPYFKVPKNGNVILSDNVVLNSDFKFSNTALTYRCKFVTGYDGTIFIGKNTILNGVCVVAYENVKIGDNCQIASSTLIADTNFHPVDPAQRMRQVRGEAYNFASVKHSPIDVGNNVWIGWNVTILKGAKIGENSIVAAGSVVLAGIYPSNSIIAGNPAIVVKFI